MAKMAKISFAGMMMLMMLMMGVNGFSPSHQRIGRIFHQQQSTATTFLAVVGDHSRQLTTTCSRQSPVLSLPRHSPSSSWIMLSAAAAAASSESGDEGAADAAAAPQDGATTTTDDEYNEEMNMTEGEEEEEGAQEQEEEEQEDPELKAIKDEIADLEMTLKLKKRQLSSINDDSDEYSKAGYARKVAAMENMKKTRSRLQSSNEFSSTATVLRDFLPILDQLSDLKSKYGADEFGKQYNGLPDAMEKAFFTELDCDIYEATVGEPINKNRFVVTESEYSDTAPVDTVLRSINSGVELKGNVIRMAECIASLGPEKQEETETEDTSEDAATSSEDDSSTEQPPATSEGFEE